MHENQQRFHKQQKRDRQKNAHSQRQDSGPGHRPPHAGHIPGAKFLSRQHRESGGHTHHKSKDQKHDRAGASHRRQRLIAHKFSHDHGVCHIIKLLEDIADKNRQRKAQDELHRISRSHVILYCFHTFHSRSSAHPFPDFRPVIPGLRQSDFL